MEHNTLQGVIFDLDGTLYHDDRIYLRMIDYYFAGTPWEKEIGSVKAEMSRVLAGGNPAFRCGRFAPQGTGDQLYKAFGLDARSVADSVEEMLHEQ